MRQVETAQGAETARNTHIELSELSEMGDVRLTEKKRSHLYNKEQEYFLQFLNFFCFAVNFYKFVNKNTRLFIPMIYLLVDWLIL